jgi:hypothetical protein
MPEHSSSKIWVVINGHLPRIPAMPNGSNRRGARGARARSSSGGGSSSRCRPPILMTSVGAADVGFNDVSHVDCIAVCLTKGCISSDRTDTAQRSTSGLTQSRVFEYSGPTHFTELVSIRGRHHRHMSRAVRNGRVQSIGPNRPIVFPKRGCR